MTIAYLGTHDHRFARGRAVELEDGALVDVPRVGVGVVEAARLDAAGHLALHLAEL